MKEKSKHQRKTSQDLAQWADSDDDDEWNLKLELPIKEEQKRIEVTPQEKAFQEDSDSFDDWDLMTPRPSENFKPKIPILQTKKVTKEYIQEKTTSSPKVHIKPTITPIDTQNIGISSNNGGNKDGLDSSTVSETLDTPTRSSIDINVWAEDDDSASWSDDSIDKLKDPINAPMTPVTQISLQAFKEDSQSESEDWDDLDNDNTEDNSTNLLEILKQKQLMSSVVTIEEDPFQDLEEDTGEGDIEFNLDEHVRKAHAQEVFGNIKKNLSIILDTNQNDDSITNACKQLTNTLREYQDQKELMLENEGVIPIIDMLLTSNLNVLPFILEVVNEVIEDERHIQESFQKMGGIPTIIEFWGSLKNRDNGNNKNCGFYPVPIREETIKFFKSLVKSSNEETVVKTFIENGALPAVGYLLEPTSNYKENKNVALFGLNLIHKMLFDPNIGIKKNGLCRLWARSGFFPSLIRTLVNITTDEPSITRSDIIKKISQMITLFSKMDGTVKVLFCSHEVLEPLFKILHKLEKDRMLDILKAIHAFSQESRTLDSFQKAGAIRTFVSLMGLWKSKRISETHIVPVLQIVFNLCRLVSSRQEEAASEGVIPYLKHVIETNLTSKQFALPIIFELSRAKKALPYLWENNCVEFYVELFKQVYPWQVLAVDAIAAWLSVEPDKVSSVIVKKQNAQALCHLFETLQGDQFVHLIEPVLKIIQHKNISASLVNEGFLDLLLKRINHLHTVIVRVNLLRILTCLFESQAIGKDLVEKYQLKKVVDDLTQDKAVLVSEMAAQLQKAVAGAL